MVLSDDKDGLNEIRRREHSEVCRLFLEDGRSMNIMIENIPGHISSLPIKFQVTGKVDMPETK